PELSAKIEFVCSDMWKPYLGVIREKCSQALNILDRFHIVAKVNKALDEIRSAEARRMKDDGYEPVLTKSRWCLLKRPANLTANQKVKLEVFLEQVGANALQVVAHQIFQFYLLVGGEVRRPLEKAPAGLGQDRFVSVVLHAPGFGGADVVERLVHLGHDVEPVEDIECLGTLLANHAQIRFPHVGADELDFRRHLRANHGKEFLEGFHGPFLANPQQPGTAQIDLIHQGQIFVR